MAEIQNEGGNFYDSWGLSQEDIGYIQSSNFTDASAIIKSLRDTKSYVGMDKNDLIKIPKPDKDGNVDYSEVWNRLGRPETVEGYQLPETDFAKSIAPHLHEIGITSAQADKLVEFINKYEEDAGKASKDSEREANLKSEEALKKEWGADYEVRTEAVGELVRKLAADLQFTESDFDNLQKTMGYDKAMKLLYTFAGDNAVKNLKNYNSGQETPEIASFKLKEMMADPETAKALSKNDPKIVSEIKRLTELSMQKK